MVTGVIAAMRQELETLQKALDNSRHHRVAGVDFYTGSLDGSEVVLALGGIGKVNAAMTTALMLEKFAPEAVVNTGSAGGIGSGLRVGDVVIGVQTAHHDVDATVFGYVHGQVPGMPARYDSDSRLAAAAEAAAEIFEGAAVHRGLIVSGDSFIGSKAAAQRILEEFPEALAVEMEAAAIAQVCSRFEVPFVVMRAISDNGDEDAGMSFEDFIEAAGRTSAQMVREMVRSLTA